MIRPIVRFLQNRTGKESACVAGKTRDREVGVSATADAKSLTDFAGDSHLLLTPRLLMKKSNLFSI